MKRKLLNILLVGIVLLLSGCVKYISEKSKDSHYTFYDDNSEIIGYMDKDMKNFKGDAEESLKITIRQLERFMQQLRESDVKLQKELNDKKKDEEKTRTPEKLER